MKFYNTENTKSIKITRNAKGFPIIVFQDMGESQEPTSIENKSIYLPIRTSQKFLYGIDKLEKGIIKEFQISYQTGKERKINRSFGIKKEFCEFIIFLKLEDSIVNEFRFPMCEFESTDLSGVKNTDKYSFDFNTFKEWIKSTISSTLNDETSFVKINVNKKPVEVKKEVKG